MKLEDYGFIGDMHTCALVGANGSIDWLCMPRFDSNAILAALLGDEDNGFWRIAPTQKVRSVAQQYRDETLILETTFETESGRAKVIDCMPLLGTHTDVVRIVEGMEGSVRFRLKLKIRFDYGRTVPWVRHEDGGIIAVAGPDAVMLRSEEETHGEGLATVADFEIAAGESKAFALTWFLSHELPPEPIDVRRAVMHAEHYWREWAGRCTYRGEWRKVLLRSLLTLKALTYAPTGGILAAATTSLPEYLGGVRNWDYRFCWLRDATFTLYSLMEAGYTEEASEWTQWLLRAVAGDPSQLQIMYGAAGERRLTEVELRHLGGYEGSRPVRIGNVAAEQFQLDVYGELMDAMHVARRVGITPGADAWHLQRHIVDFVEKNWTEPDEGIWEIRGPRRHFTHSKVMAWVVLDRAVKAVEEFSLEGPLERWRETRERMHAQICREGYSPSLKSFTQYYGSETVDASLLMIPLVGFLPPEDERVAGTVEAVRRLLTQDGFIFRYDPKTSLSVDGLPPGEGVFLPCNFWLVDCLTMLDRHDEARALLEKLMALRTRLGLLSEEYDTVNGRLVGNFPQAFTHVGLINSVRNLCDRVAGPARNRAVS